MDNRRGATDHKSHGSDHVMILSNGLDHFSDQQKEKEMGLRLNYFNKSTWLWFCGFCHWSVFDSYFSVLVIYQQR